MSRDRQPARNPTVRRSTTTQESRRRSPFAILSLCLFLVAAGLAGALVLQTHAGNHHTDPLQATVVALRTAMLGQQAQAVVRQTEIAQLQLRIIQLQGTVTAAQTPTRQ